jgi:dipeptidyl aminopeptidase/acylaminoacyl peptidase
MPDAGQPDCGHLMARRVAIGIARVLCALLAATASHGVYAGAQPPPPEAFTLSGESTLRLSPSGRWLAWIDHAQPELRVVMYDVAAQKVQRTLAMTQDTEAYQLLWSDDDTLLVFVTGKKLGALAYHMAADKVTPITSGNLVSAVTTKPHTVIMARGKFLSEVDTQTGAWTPVKTGTDSTTRWVVDRDGNAVAREDWDQRRSAYHVFAVRDQDNKREILRQDDVKPPILTGLLPDGSALVLLATNGHAHQAAWALPLDGSPLRLLAEDPDSDITNTITDAHTGAIVGVYVSGSEAAVRWLDPEIRRRHEILKHSFPDRLVELYGWTADGAKALAQVETGSKPPVFYLVDFATKGAQIAGQEYPTLSDVVLGEVREITYKARDGAAIPAYLTLPPGKTTSPVPLIVVPHAYPDTRDYPTFNFFSQFLASRGYAVLQPEYRGSTGFGEAFRAAGDRQWGGRIQTDIADGVQTLVEQHVADPHRVCIVGAAYGGYAALAGAAFTPDLYACAVSISGIADLRALTRNIRSIDSDWASARIGGWNAGVLAAISPINSVKSIRIPILLIYRSGEKQSEDFAHALSGAGKYGTSIVLPGYFQWTSSKVIQVQILTELDTFLKNHLQAAD